MLTTTCRTGCVSNPPWATKIIADVYERLPSMGVPPAFLPRMDGLVDVPPFDMVEAHLQELGCGAYGCVFPTWDPKVVLKLTADDTEAEFASEIAGSLDRPICVHYLTVIRPEGAVDKKGTQVYLLWREAADHVGKIAEYLDDRDGSDRGDKAIELINRQHAIAQQAYATLTNVFYAGRQSRALKRGEQLILHQVISDWLESCETMARQTAVPDLRELGDGLVEVYRTQRILFGDIHAGNIGMVHREDGDHWVITDPGHIAVVDAEI
jgi:hypothetical protein